MSNAFDPYRIWLGIPIEERPPDLYRLLGISRFESDPEVIESAADRQMGHVQRHKIGPHASESQRLLNELSSARGTLLHREKKAAYDRELRAKMAPAPRGPAAPSSPSMASVVPVRPVGPQGTPAGGSAVPAQRVGQPDTKGTRPSGFQPGPGPSAPGGRAVPERSGPPDSTRSMERPRASSSQVIPVAGVRSGMTPAHVTPAHVTPAHVTPAHVTPAHVTPAHVTPAAMTPGFVAPAQPVSVAKSGESAIQPAAAKPFAAGGGVAPARPMPLQPTAKSNRPISGAGPQSPRSARSEGDDLFDFDVSASASEARQRELMARRRPIKLRRRRMIKLGAAVALGVVALGWILQHKWRAQPEPSQIASAAAAASGSPSTAASGAATTAGKQRQAAGGAEPAIVNEPAVVNEPARPKDQFDTRLEAAKPKTYEILNVVRSRKGLPRGWSLQGDATTAALHCELSESGAPSVLRLGVEPPLEYAIRATVNRSPDAEIDFGLASGDSRFVLTIDGGLDHSVTAPQQIDGESGDRNPAARRKATLSPDVDHQLLLTVLRSGVALDCDGRRVFTWSQGVERLGENAADTGAATQLALGGSGGAFTVRSAALQSISGEAPKIIRGATPARPVAGDSPASPDAQPPDQVASNASPPETPRPMVPAANDQPAANPASPAATLAPTASKTGAEGLDLGRLVPPLKSLHHEGESLLYLAISPDAKMIVYGSARTAYSLDLRTSVKNTAPSTQTIVDAAFTRDGQRLILLTRACPVISRIEGGPMQEGARLGLNVAMARDGSAAAAFDTNLRRWIFYDPETGGVLANAPEIVDRGASAPKLSQGAHYVCLFAPFNAAGDAASLKKLYNLRPVKDLPLDFQAPGDAVRVAAFSTNAQLAMVRIAHPSEVKIYDIPTETFKPTAIVNPNDEAVTALAFSPNGKLLVVGGGAGSMRILNASTGETWGMCVGSRGQIQHVAVSADGAAVVASDLNGDINVWPLPTMSETTGAPVVLKDPPSGAEQRAALAAIKEAFADDYRKARKPEEKLSLAEKLLSHAATDPVVAEKFVLLQEARDLGEAAGEPLLILQSIDAAGRDFKVDVVETVLERIDALTKMSSVPQTRIALVGALTHYADRAVAEEKFDAANKLLAAAVTIARKLKGRELLVKTTIGRQTDVAYQIDQLQKVKAAEATLAHGDDPAADLILGKYYCLNRGDWQTGLPYLAKSSDADLKKIAADELALAEAPEPKDANLQLQLADRWQAVADAAASREKSKCGARAAFWYRAALPRLEGVAAVRVKKRLAEFDEGADRQ